MAVTRIPDGEFSKAYSDLAALPHLLVLGSPGSGKTSVLHGIMASLLSNHSPIDTRIVIMDSTQTEFTKYQALPQVLSCVRRRDESIPVLQAILEMIRSRFDDMQKRKEKVYEGPHLYLLVDELCDALSDNPGMFGRLLCRICQIGWPARVHVFVTAATPLASDAAKAMAEIIPRRIGLHMETALESRLLIGRDGCEGLPPFGRGFLRITRTAKKISLDPVPAGKAESLVSFWASLDCRCGDLSIDRRALEDASAGFTDRAVSAEKDPAKTHQVLLIAAVEAAIELGQITVPALQRRLLIVYAQAGILVDEMEHRSLIAPPDRDNVRQCLVDRDGLNKMMRDGTI